MKKGFTLVELLAVILILGLVAVIIIPSYINSANTIKTSNLDSMKKMISNSMLNYANQNYIDQIKPSNNTCNTDNCCKYYSIDFIKANNIFQTTNGNIINPVTNNELDGYIKISYDTVNLELVSEYKENNSDIGNCTDEFTDYSTIDNIDNREPYTVVNLIKNGSFENGTNNWILEDASIVSDNTYGNKILRFESGITSMSKQYLDYLKPTINHKYYGRLMFKSNSTFTSSDNRYEWYYNDDSNKGRMIFIFKNIKNDSWTKLSSIKTLTDSTYLNEKWYIRNFQVNASAYSYVDELLLIDLTEAFGIGNEPSKEWCDENINYFDGSKIIYK